MQKITTRITGTLYLFFIVWLFTLIGCAGCGGVKEVNQNDINSNNDIVFIDTTSQIWQDQHYYRGTKTPLPDSLKGKSGLGESFYYQEPDSLEDKIFITLNDGDLSNRDVDEYNVFKQILRFKDPKTDQVIKAIDVVKENPFHQLGFERRKEPDPDVYYFLKKKGTEKKHDLKQYLPKEIFKEIPEDFVFYRAIAEVNIRTTDSKYATINYQLDWLPDAYYDNGEWNGPGYGSHFIVVYDSLGHKIFSKQFGGFSDGFSVSEDGKYLFNTICLSPEWDENIRYKFMAINIKTNKIVYEELIENGKLNGGGGDFFNNFYNSNGNYVELKNNNVIGFTYINSKFYRYEDQLKFKIKIKSKDKLKLIFPDGKESFIKIDSLYQNITLS